jgi:Holliday junction DNA helicase RuvA
LQQAIAGGDVDALSGVSGVGRRIASRIVLELKGQLELDQEIPAMTRASDDMEVIEALTALGYSTNEARRAVSNLAQSPDLTLEDRIRLALQQMGRG